MIFLEYFLLFIGLLVCAFFYKTVAKKFNIVDNPNFRSSHTIPTIRGGGILFFLAVIVYFFRFSYPYPYLILGISLIAAISFLDDLYALSVSIRLPFHFIAVGLLLYQLGWFDVFSVSTYVLWVLGVAFMNSYNFMDGINGITFMYSLVVLAFFSLMAYMENSMSFQLTMYVLISLLIFGFFNVRKKAVFFAGDIGSMTLAILVLFMGLYFILKLNTPIFLCAVSVYAVDSGLTIAYRLWLGEKISQPHRHHIYQKLVDKSGWSHLKVSFYYGFIQLLICLGILFLYQTELWIQYMYTFGVCIILVLGYYSIFKKLTV
ncbi:MAG: UDP-GlcNAc--UDP-phosphate GlcNAc-1-phosphate transferase [Alteromonas sp.]|nr:UDP-GlcNAc--UDP-phosphate GlcNAc-1-phosphate transferase [Alteromonas sp.]|tara:strand:- start:17636 stop:18589 length:954 start_codon:yes stop_codon:yes gene_type:complete